MKEPSSFIFFLSSVVTTLVGLPNAVLWNGDVGDVGDRCGSVVWLVEVEATSMGPN